MDIEFNGLVDSTVLYRLVLAILLGGVEGSGNEFSIDLQQGQRSGGDADGPLRTGRSPGGQQLIFDIRERFRRPV